MLPILVPESPPFYFVTDFITTEAWRTRRIPIFLFLCALRVFVVHFAVNPLKRRIHVGKHSRIPLPVP